MKNKLIQLSTAVKTFVKDRSMILAGGFPMSRQVNAFIKEILRQRKAGNLKLNDMFWVEPGVGFGGDLLIAEGVVDSVISTFSSHARPGLSMVVRRALEQGIPRKIKWEDESNLTLNLKVMAGALNLPFIPSNSGVWGDLKNQGLWDGAHSYPKNVIHEDPYGSGKKVALLQALRPELSVVHVQFADTRGNGMILGSMYYDYWSGRAGKDIILIADRIIDSEMCARFPNLVAIPGAGVTAVVPWYLGSWPANSPGLYGEDLEHMSSFVKISRSEDSLREYIEKYVYSWKTYDDYLDLIGRDKIKSLECNPSTVLAEAFQQWIYPEEKVRELLAQNQTTPIGNAVDQVAK
jgi:glutaconate CoA-transferase subunit A